MCEHVNIKILLHETLTRGWCAESVCKRIKDGVVVQRCVNPMSAVKVFVAGEAVRKQMPVVGIESADGDIRNRLLAAITCYLHHYCMTPLLPLQGALCQVYAFLACAICGRNAMLVQSSWAVKMLHDCLTPHRARPNRAWQFVN